MDTTGYSLSDLASVTNGSMGGNSWWLIIFFLIIFGGGFNGWNNRQGELGQYATASSQQEILFNQKFDALGQKINAVGDGIASLGYNQLQQMDANTSSINGNISTEARALQMQICQLNNNIDNKFAQLEKTQLEQTIASQASQINQLALAQQMAGVVKYPMASTYAMLNNPFCGCGTCCAN